MPMLRRADLLALALVTVAAATASSAPPTDDRFADLVVGVPEEDLSDITDAGAVDYLGGGATGVSVDDPGWWMQGMTGIGETQEPSDLFGHALATGDFNGDGRADVVVAAPGEDPIGPLGLGLVHVFYGTIDGTIDSEIWRQQSAGLPTPPPETYFFGIALTAGDFDHDGHDDLAIGAVGMQTGGSVVVLRGSVDGLTAAGSQLWHQDIAGVDGANESDDEWGGVLAAGDFDGDGFEDLAVGARGQATGGAVHLFYGSAGGLDASRDDQMDQSDLVSGEAENGDAFGDALAVGDFDRDGYDDLVIGARREDVGTVTDAGAVFVAFGGPAGIDGTRVRVFDQRVYNAEGGAEEDDHFGRAVAAGDFDGDGYDDLAVGAPFEDLGTVTSAGSVFVVGGADDFASAGWHFSQGVGGVLGAAELGDLFGGALAAGDFDGDGFDDLAVGARGESLEATSDNYAGCLHVLYGTSAGLSAAGNQLLTQDSLDTSFAEPYDSWGSVLLAVERPALFTDGFETGAPLRWSSHQP